MARAVSIHIGINEPADRSLRPARHTEEAAWKMAELASQAGYQSIRVLLAQEATRPAVHDALAGASQVLKGGDMLLVTYSGHGRQLRHPHAEDADGSDECWCLADEHLLDNALAGYWRLFDSGVRIVVVAESCHGGGMGRGSYGPDAAPVNVPGLVAYRSARGSSRSTEPWPVYKPSCTLEAPRNPNGIRASVLLLAAAAEDQQARDNAFTSALLAVWENGNFRGDYLELYEKVKSKVMSEAKHEVQLLWLGAHDALFPLARAFRPDRTPVGNVAAAPAAPPAPPAPPPPTTPNTPGTPDAPDPSTSRLRQPPPGWGGTARTPKE